MRNIFSSEKLELVNDIAALPQYDIVADKEMKEYNKKVKKNGLLNRRLCESGVTFSHKSYTIRTNEQSENYYTKEELVNTIVKRYNENNQT